MHWNHFIGLLYYYHQRHYHGMEGALPHFPSPVFFQSLTSHEIVSSWRKLLVTAHYRLWYLKLRNSGSFITPLYIHY